MEVLFVNTIVLSKNAFGLRLEVWGVIDAVVIVSKFFGMVNPKMLKTLTSRNAIRLNFAFDDGY